VSTITVQDLQRDPSGFLRRVEAGESFLVVQGDQPVAEVRPISPEKRELRPFGLSAGRFKVPDDFNDPLPEEILKGFMGT
jgi:antitoxin (DNA-binding transcriptional repressor) of toxin-antitoxin stability system